MSTSPPPVRANKVAGDSSARGRRSERFETQRAQSRRRLLDAARLIFERDGFLGARVTDIAAEAGLAHGSFYSYFTSKEDIFVNIAHEIDEDMFVHPRSDLPGDGDPVSAIYVTNRDYFRAYERNAKMMALVEQVATFNDGILSIRQERSRLFIERAERMIRRLQGEGRADPEIDPYQTAFALCSMVSRIASLVFMQHEKFDLDQGTRTVTDIWVRAIGILPCRE